MADSKENEVVLKLVVQGANPEEARRLVGSSMSAIQAELNAALGRQVAAHRAAAEAQTKEARKAAQEEIRTAANTTKQLAAAIGERGKLDRQAAAEAVKAAREVERERIRAERSAAREAAAAGRDRERSDREAARAAIAATKERERAAKQADAEIQRMGRAQSAAIAENARRDAAAARQAERLAKERRSSMSLLIQDLSHASNIAQNVWGVIGAGKDRFNQLRDEIIRTTNVFNSFTGSVQRAADATDGTVSNMDLIIAKNRAMEMDLELSEEQFALVAAQADRYADAIGTDVSDALDKLIKGLATGQERALRNAGIVINADKAYEKFALRLGITADKLNDLGKKLAIQADAFDKMKQKAADADSVMAKPASLATVMEQSLVASKNVWNEMLATIGSWQPPQWLVAFLTAGEASFVAARRKLDNATLNYQAPGTFRRLGQEPADELAFLRKKNILPTGVSLDDVVEKEKATRQRLTYAAPDTVTGIDRLFYAGEQMEMDRLADIEAEARANSPETIARLKTTDDLMAEATGGLGDGDIVARAEKMLEQFNATSEKAGGGILARILFGPGGPDEVYEQMSRFEQAVVDSMGLLTKAGEGMAGAFGQAFAAAMSGEKSFVEALKDGTRQVLKNLAAEAATRAIMELAHGTAALFFNPAAAGGHFAAAGLYASVAGVAGLGLRAIGPGSKGSSAGARSTESRSPSFASAQSRTSGSDRRDLPPVYINVNVPPGGEAESGRSIVKALQALEAQSGRPVVTMLSAA